MPLYVRDIKLGLDEPDDKLLDRLAARLKVAPSAIRIYAVVRRSLDARSRHQSQGEIHFVHALEVALDDSIANEERLVRRLHRADVSMLQPAQVHEPEPAARSGGRTLRHRPIIVGFGPAGMFAAWQLARFGYRPIVLERGQPVSVRHKDVLQKFYGQRIFNSESNLLYGEGGAGTYSDGKLYTRVNEPYVRIVLQTFYEHGASPDILIDGKPHIGSDRLPNICRRMRQHIEKMGGEIRFGARLDNLCTDEDGGVSGVEIGEESLSADRVLLAIGHSARDTLRMLHARGVTLTAKPFQLGVRIEHPQTMVDRWQYGGCAGHDRLPPASYQTVAKGAAGSGGDLFSFCMCPGGQILPTNESPGLVVTNGASRAAHSGPFANSGLVITVDPEVFGNDPLQGLAYQQKWESLAFEATGGAYAVPAQRASDFLQRRASDGPLETSYPLGGQWADLRRLLPDYFIESLERGLRMIDRRMPGFAGADGLITAPETRASAPVRILRSAETRESVSTAGLYPIGEGAGYAGGIISAAIDGLKTADHIIRQFAAAR